MSTRTRRKSSRTTSNDLIAMRRCDAAEDEAALATAALATPPSKRGRGRPVHTPEQKADATERKKQRQRDARAAKSRKKMQQLVDAAAAEAAVQERARAHAASPLPTLPAWATPLEEPPKVVWAPVCMNWVCPTIVGGHKGARPTPTRSRAVALRALRSASIT